MAFEKSGNENWQGKLEIGEAGYCWAGTLITNTMHIAIQNVHVQVRYRATRMKLVDTNI